MGVIELWKAMEIDEGKQDEQKGFTNGCGAYDKHHE